MYEGRWIKLWEPPDRYTTGALMPIVGLVWPAKIVPMLLLMHIFGGAGVKRASWGARN